MMLGAGLGFAVYSPLTADYPVANLSIGGLIIHSICAIASLWFGGWVAGRFSSVRNRATGWLHGFIVWAVATVAGVILVTSGAAWLMSGLSTVVGGGLSAVGQPAAAAAGAAADQAADELKQSAASIAIYVEEAVNNRGEGSASDGVRAKREIGFAMARLFHPAHAGNVAANREAAVTALVNHAGMNPADADTAITDWTASFERLKSDLATVKDAAAQKTREATDTAASALAKFSLLAFIGFLIGALAATWGGHLGSKCAARSAGISDDDVLIGDEKI